MTKWMVSAKKADFNKIAEKYNISPVTARLIVNRNIREDKDIDMYLNGDMSYLPAPDSLLNMKKGAEIIKKGIEENKNIRVIGDYDVDGITSSFILYSGLKKAGGNVSVRLPHRIKDGYGLNERLVMEAHNDGIDIILTCDNGIAAYEQIKLAKELNMTVVVTDHHEVPFKEENGIKTEILPPADVVIDPKQEKDSTEFKEICGAEIAYKFIDVLFNMMSWLEDKKEFMEELVIFAGLGTVCDVMPLINENRIIVKESLKNIKNCYNPGLKALIEVNGLSDMDISCYHYGFILGPCLNAAGRLDSAMLSLKLLMTENKEDALTIATELKELNDKRKDLTEKGLKTADEFIKEEYQGVIPKVIVIYLKDSHESVAGIIAGKIREKYNRPALVITKANDMCKGSGRSTDNYNMFMKMSECKELFEKFGGHKLAAGFSLKEENIDKLRYELNNRCNIKDEDFEPTEHIDMVMPLKYISRNLIKEIELLAPFGTGNSKPIFAEKNIRLISGRILGKNKNCGKYKITDSDNFMHEMIYFGNMDNWKEFLLNRFGNECYDKLYDGSLNKGLPMNIIYYPNINVFNGIENLQIVMQDYC